MQINDSKHDHPEYERRSDAIQRYTILQSVISQGFADMLSEIRDGFARTNEGFDKLEVRVAGIELRLDQIEAFLRERLGPNGKP